MSLPTNREQLDIAITRAALERCTTQELLEELVKRDGVSYLTIRKTEECKISCGELKTNWYAPAMVIIVRTPAARDTTDDDKNVDYRGYP